MLKGSTKDQQSVDSKGKQSISLLDGVSKYEVPNIVTRNGITTEMFRPEWPVGPDHVRHMIHVQLRPDAISAWHMHEYQTDTFFVSRGSIKLVLFDDREESPTRGELNVFHLSRFRPIVLTVPPGVWHGLQNLENSESCFINYFDRPYSYEDPDEWRLPLDTEQIPYSFAPFS